MLWRIDAVANLIATSAGMDLVRKINDRYQYATVSEMKMPGIDAWIAESGLTREEVITIQVPSRFPGEEDGKMVVRFPIEQQDSLGTPASDATEPLQNEESIEQVEKPTPGLTQVFATEADRSVLGTR